MAVAAIALHGKFLITSDVQWNGMIGQPILSNSILYYPVCVYIYRERDVYMAYNNVYIHIVCHVISINIDMSDMYIQYSTERWALLDQPPHQVPHVHWPQIVDSITDFQCWLLGRQSLKSKRSPSECWCLQYMLHLTASSIIQCHPTQSHGQIIRNSSHGCHHQSLRWILAAPLLRSRVAGPRIPGTPRHWAGLPLTAIKARPVQWNWYMKKIYGLRKKICGLFVPWFWPINIINVHSGQLFTMWKYLDAHRSCWISFPEAFRKRLKTMRIRWTVASVLVHPKNIF